MAMAKLKLRPGVDLEESSTLNAAQLSKSNLIRFYASLPQKLGGWLQLSLDLFIGICRALHGWSDIIGDAYLAVGTDQRLSVLTGGVLYDITPIVSTTNPAVSFSTLAGSTVVTIQDASYSPSAGDWVNLLTQVAVGGIVLHGYYKVAEQVDGTHYSIIAADPATITVTGGAVPLFTTQFGLANVTVTLANHHLAIGDLFPVEVSTTVATVVISGIYPVDSVTNSNQFVIVAATPATGVASGSENGGNARFEYLLPSGNSAAMFLRGYGAGLYGAGLYGGAGDASTTTAPLRQWSLDHYGQDLIASPTNGKIYYWQPPTIAPAVVVSPDAPLYSIAVFVQPQARIIVALGAETGTVQEPLLVRWCDAGDFTGWIPTAFNQAGSYQLPTGSKLIGGLAAGQGALLWTDVDLWSMTYQGLPFVFGFNRVATACGLIAQRAMGISGTFVMWLSTRGFFTFSGGGVTPVECSVWDFIINNLDLMQVAQVHCAVNALFNEMAWHFPLAPTSPYYVAAGISVVPGFGNLLDSTGASWNLTSGGVAMRNGFAVTGGTGMSVLTNYSGTIYGQDATTGGWSLYNETAFAGSVIPPQPVLMGYVKCNYVENLVWDYGVSSQYQRTAWTGTSPIGNPVGSDYAGLLQQHEVGYDANGSGMQWMWETGYFDIHEGEDFIFCDLLIPDNGVTIGNPTIYYTIISQLYPNGPELETPLGGANDNTQFLPFRVRARQMAIRAEGNDLGTFNRLGGPRYRFAPDGRN